MAQVEINARREWDALTVSRIVAAARAIPSTSPYFINCSGLSLPAVSRSLSETVDSVKGPGLIIGRSMMVDQIVDELCKTPRADTARVDNQMNGEILWWRNGLVVRTFHSQFETFRLPRNEMYVTGLDQAIEGNIDIAYRIVDTSMAP